MDPRRTQRLSEALREELSELVEFEMSDPRLGGVTVTAVHVSPDGRYARVLVTTGDSDREQRQALEALEHARHYLRHELAGRMRLFRVPELHFEPDTSGGGEDRVEQLLRRIRKNREKREKPPDPPA